MALNEEFWQGRRVLVTGHTGFKGSWLCLWLQRLGAEVTGLALDPPSEPNLFELAHVGRGIRSLRGDVCDAAAVGAALDKARPEIVFHLAARALVLESYDDPVGTFQTNVLGTVNLLEGLRRSPSVRAAVIVTTDKCYANEERLQRGYCETDALGGHDVYSSSKAAAEIMTQAWRASFFAPQGRPAVATARGGNVIGGGDWARDRLVPDVIRSVLSGKRVQLRKPQAVRPWQHVLDLLCGYLLLAEALHEQGELFAEAWNFGPNEMDAQSVRWVVDYLLRSWVPAAGWARDEGEYPHETCYLRLDATKAKSRLEWQPRLRLPEALDWTVQWYRSFAQRADLRAVSESQIEQFQALETVTCLRERRDFY